MNLLFDVEDLDMLSEDDRQKFGEYRCTWLHVNGELSLLEVLECELHDGDCLLMM